MSSLSSHPYALPALLLLTTTLSYLATPTRHSLLTSTCASILLCAYTTARTSWRELLEGQRIAWLAGTLLALASTQDGATGAGGSIWWAKGLLPLTVYTLSRTDVFGAENSASRQDNDREGLGKAAETSGSKSGFAGLAVLSAAAVTAVWRGTGSNATLSLGLSSAVFTGLALRLVELAQKEALEQTHQNGSVIYSASGFLAQPAEPKSAGSEEGEVTIRVVRDVSAAAAVGTGVASLLMEGWRFGSLVGIGTWDHRASERVFGLGEGFLAVTWACVMVGMHTGMLGSLLLMIQRHDAFTTAFVPLYAALCAQLISAFSLSRAWFAALCALSTFVFLADNDAGGLSSIGGGRMKGRFSKLLVLVALASFASLAAWSWRNGGPGLRYPLPIGKSDGKPALEVQTPVKELGPLQYTDTRVHPVDQLVRDAEADFLALLQRQSGTLEEAVTQYKRRYGLRPPPNFDKWYEFAKRKNVQLIDEYDTIYHSLLPFWALPPSTIRQRVRDALGFGPNNLMAVLIRDGKAVHVEGGQEWLQEAVVGMIQDFVQYLPDMDLAFNIHDEPRVVVPHDELHRMVQLATTQHLPAALTHPSPRNSFSPRPADVKNSKRIAEVKTTHFNVFAHQPTWLPSRLSCPADSPARSLLDPSPDNLTAYALSDLGWIYNHTAYTDVCLSPSLATSHGFFDRPNAFNVVHELVPIFSQSKMSSFQDILYPSPWYWYGKVSYDESRDTTWAQKTNSLWWRGSTTGGFSRDGGWRRQHRQLMVGKLNALDAAKILKDVNADKPDRTPDYQVREVPRQDYKELIDIHFSHIGQCDPGDCDAQKEFFAVTKPVDQQDAWKYRFLLDMDGNAFSGRFYAFLQSHSLTFKMAVFREWHEEWIKPWVHYIPLSLRADEALETVKYLSVEGEGKAQATRMAEGSREWAGKVLRNEDFEAWLFRLLLEYGRVVDDEREGIGFGG